MDKQEIFKQILGKCIRKKRLSEGMTLENLADQLKMDDKHLARIERGEKRPSAYTLALIQIALDIHSDEYVLEFKQAINPYQS